MNTFLQAYLVAALWSSTDDDGTPLDSEYSIDDIAPETLAAAEKDCVLFLERSAHLRLGPNAPEGMDDAQAGHDFWLTRNGHGAGFWDGDWDEIGDDLTAISKAFPQVDLYVGDDGKIYA